MNGSSAVFDVLVIGSGAAGLTLALKIAPFAKVAVISKADAEAGSTRYAQGGIAAVLEKTDSIGAHIADTLAAGDGLCHEEAVRFVCERGRAAIETLIARGVPFSPAHPGDEGCTFHLTREGGHSHRRVIHVADATGKAVETTLADLARAEPNITLFERHAAIDLIMRRNLENPAEGEANSCYGAYLYDLRADAVKAVRAKATILATGGASKVYLYTSNPDGSTGDGIAMAWRAGCRIANMEFNQFHPTCLYHPEAKSFLVTEAMRGEGALLKLPGGERFMDRYHPLAELAPRDVVARAIDAEMKRHGLECVHLDISHKDPDFIIGHFPNIYRRAMSLGIDITRQPVPVVPAAHYTCGGVVTDLSGRTDVSNLYAIGETAHTGLHGANRLASNSMLECLVFAHAAGKDIEEKLKTAPPPLEARPWDVSKVRDSDEEVVVSHNWDELRRFMWDYVGIVRTTKRLLRAKSRVDLLRKEISDYYGHFHITADLIELRNLVEVADLIVRSALERRESRGLHYTADYPEKAAVAADTILTPPVRA